MILALTPEKHLLLVRQFRHGQNMTTLEMPAGHVEKDETPEQAARKELCEETGYEAGALELLSSVAVSTARFENRLWIYFAPDVKPAVNPQHEREAGVELVVWKKDFRALLDEKEFISASTHAAIFAAAARGKIKL